MPHLIRNTFMTMFKEILDKFVWVMIKPCKIVGMGKVLVKQHNGNQWLLKEVRHVPDLKKNLISTGQLGSEGCVTTFIDKAW